MSGTAMVSFYTSNSQADIVDGTLDVCEDVGFDIEDQREPFPKPSDEDTYATELPYGVWSITLRFDLSDERDPNEPALTVGPLDEALYPSTVTDEDEYRHRMDVIFEVVCRLAVALEAEYVPLIETAGRSQAVVPSGRPIGTNVETAPRFGIYSEEVLGQFGGLSTLFDTTPWYTAILEGGQTVVIESGSPWTKGGWEPPTDAEFIQRAEFHTESGADSADLSDPFSSFDVGEFGTEVGVAPDGISDQFANEDLQLVRVRVDDDRNLRRVSDGSFVRNIVDDAETDEAFVRGMLGDVPPEASDGDLLVSALVHEAIPPSFVRLDDPDGENVVTKVMALDVETNKHALLVSLGEATQSGESTAGTLEKVERALDNLAGLEGVEGIDGWIEDNLV